jgi:hypothetical protein
MVSEVVIEIRGGVLVEIYSDDPDTRFVVVDWDRIATDEETATAFAWRATKMDRMPEDTSAEYRQAIESPGTDGGAIPEC